jgi:hypothetical protein
MFIASYFRMKKLLIIAILLNFAGCAGQTAHDYCQANLEHYRDYNECYQEVSLNKKNRSAGSRFLKGFSESYSAKNQVHCTSSTIGGITQTDCD